MKNILYCFITHQSKLKTDKNRIQYMCENLNIKDYIIVCGGYKKSNLADNVLKLNCDDSYEGLPDKIHKMFEYISEHLPYYEFYAKFDRTIELVSTVDTKNLSHYSGMILDVNVAERDYHFTKCSENSHWNNKLYTGLYVPWCNGPYYFLSRVSVNIVAHHSPDLEEEIYEDLYVAKTLRLYNIVPEQLSEEVKSSIVDDIAQDI